jgi:hypothetical protein
MGFDADGNLIVADAYFGLLSINVTTAKVRLQYVQDEFCLLCVFAGGGRERKRERKKEREKEREKERKARKREKEELQREE